MMTATMHFPSLPASQRESAQSARIAGALAVCALVLGVSLALRDRCPGAGAGPVEAHAASTLAPITAVATHEPPPRAGHRSCARSRPSNRISWRT